MGRPSVGPMAKPRTPKGRTREVARRLAEEYPDAVCELDHRNAFELLAATILSAQTHRRPGQHGDAGAVRPLPDAGRPRRRRSGRGRGHHPLDRLLPEQDDEPHRHGRGARRALRRRGADRRSTTSSRCPASAARPATSCAAWRSGCPGCRSTPTSGGCRAGSALTDAGRPGEDRARARTATCRRRERGPLQPADDPARSPRCAPPVRRSAARCVLEDICPSSRFRAGAAPPELGKWRSIGRISGSVEVEVAVMW